MRVIRSKLDYVDTEYRVLAKLNGKTVGFIDKNLNGTYSYAFGRPKASYVSFNVDDLDTAKSRLEEHVFMGNSRRPVKSGYSDVEKALSGLEDYFGRTADGDTIYTRISHDDENHIANVCEDYNVDFAVGSNHVTLYPIESSRRPIKSSHPGDTFLESYKGFDIYMNLTEKGNFDCVHIYDSSTGDEIKTITSIDRNETGYRMADRAKKFIDGYITSSRKPVKSGYEGDDAEAKELALYIKNTSELYHGITHSVIENLKKKARKGVYDKERAVDAWMYVADAGAKMYDKEFGSGRGSLTMFSKSDRRKAAEELARYYEEDVLEGLDNVQSAFNLIQSAVDGGWEVDSSDVPEALDLFVEYYGEEYALESIAKAMGSDTLKENIEWIARHWGFGEELEEYDDAWDMYEHAKEVMGESELFNNLTQAAGHDELAEDLAFIFRMEDFRQWDKYDNNDDEEIESSRRISSSQSETDDFIRRVVNFGQRNGLNIPELALAFSDGRRCSHEEYLKLCKWFKNQENVDKYYSGVELTSSRRISSGKRTVDHKKPSREEIEKALDKRLAQEKVKFATDMYDDTVDYILSFWDEEDYIPKDADDAVSQWYNDTKKHFPQDLKKIASAAYRYWIRSKLIKSSKRIR